MPNSGIAFKVLVVVLCICWTSIFRLVDLGRFAFRTLITFLAAFGTRGQALILSDMHESSH